MTIRIDKPRAAGFSLVEILLTLVLILCIAAASVFTFTTLYRSANLDEGNDRFQSLIRFAQAEASTTGRKVRLQFPAHAESNKSSVAEEKTELHDIQVTWEADALNAPGVFQTYTNKTWSEEMVNELVGVQKVQSIQSPNVSAQTASIATLATNTNDETNPETVSSESSDFPTITFYPDGSCDSAEIVLASRNPDDERRVEVRLSGMLGSVSSRTVSSEEVEKKNEDDAEAAAEFDEIFSSPQTTTALSDNSTLN